jgi:predicted lipoprotein with Yx(FWY)xxD motif
MPPATTAATGTVPANATVMVRTHDTLGDILVDANGMTLYLFTRDTPNTSNCYDQCAVNWPPLLTASEPMAGTGADASLLGTTTRTDGSTQVTYNGWPLYYWVNDHMPGDATGQDVGGVWFVLDAAGEQVMTPGAQEATPEPTSAATSMGATVMITRHATLGDILTDAHGMTLYLFTRDTENTSNCYDQCAVNWPPLLVEGEPSAGTGADAALLGTTTRTDGKMQVTYNGWPLYYWVNDQKPGDATGQDVGGVWYVLDAMGEQVETPAASSAAPAAGETIEVAIVNFSFGEELTIPVGTTVVWTNEDTAPHTVTAGDGSFDSGNMEKGATFSYTFTEAGSIELLCVYHPNMKGRVTVTN